MNYNYKEIDKIYTNIIADYLSNGYTIYTPCMAGHQGEIAKVVLTNSEDELVCVYMDKEYSWDDGDGINIVIGKNEHNNYKNVVNDDILWINKLEEVKKYTFYKIDERKNNYYNNYYTDDLDFFNECKNKHNNRMSLKYEMKSNKKIELKNKKAFLIAYKICKRTKGYKTIKSKDILSVWKIKNKYYTVKINGKDDLIIKF